MTRLTPAEYITTRPEYLRVSVVKSEGEDGWDVVLRIDGSYSDRRTAEAVASGLRRRLVPPVGADWWDGPPWKRRDAA